MTRRTRVVLTGAERKAARALVAELYASGLSRSQVVVELARRGWPVSEGTVGALLREAGVTMRPQGWSGQAWAARWRRDGERS